MRSSNPLAAPLCNQFSHIETRLFRDASRRKEGVHWIGQSWQQAADKLCLALLHRFYFLQPPYCRLAKTEVSSPSSPITGNLSKIFHLARAKKGFYPCYQLKISDLLCCIEPAGRQESCALTQLNINRIVNVFVQQHSTNTHTHMYKA